MKSFIIAALLFSVTASAQDRFYYSKTESNWFEKIKEEHHPRSVDGMIYTRCFSGDHDEKYEKWIKQYPDGYEVYCDPCEVKTRDQEATEQGIFHSIGTAISSPYGYADTIVTKIDTIKCVMLISELGGPAKHQNGYGVKKGYAHLKYLDANKVEIKGFVWLSQEFEW